MANGIASSIQSTTSGTVAPTLASDGRPWDQAAPVPLGTFSCPGVGQGYQLLLYWPSESVNVPGYQWSWRFDPASAWTTEAAWTDGQRPPVLQAIQPGQHVEIELHADFETGPGPSGTGTFIAPVEPC